MSEELKKKEEMSKDVYDSAPLYREYSCGQVGRTAEVDSRTAIAPGKIFYVERLSASTVDF